MTALWLEPAPGVDPHDPTARRRPLRLVDARRRPDEPDHHGPWVADLVTVPDGRTAAGTRRRASPAVRRRRALLAAIVVLLVGLALPLSGTGGSSHATGSALVETPGASYTVQPGDTLWSIAQRVDPAGDPRPIVSELATQTGSNTVFPGERITIP